MIAGGRHAFQVLHPGSPVLRVRYRAGIVVDAHGFPDWVPYARAVVQLPPVRDDLGAHANRVVDVLAANRVLAGTDPLYADAPAGGGPAGWTWAHLPVVTPGAPRRAALVPIELHGAHRHLGGVSTARTDRTRRYLGEPGRWPVPSRVEATVADDALTKVEEHLGHALPADYRQYLRDSNGGGPHVAVVHVGLGFVADQPMFGVARPDALQDLLYANAWFGDRFTTDYVAAGYVQGGLIAVKVRGEATGSVWWFDDDDPRAKDDDTAEDVCERLLHHCADDFKVFWQMLCEPPEPLRAAAAAADVTQLHPDRMGAALPAAKRPTGPQPASGGATR
ncbi:SMI1/KNR4 family protein [Dactylosporangium sp. NPDC005555]|uniref:SMI1/KNR4 family protein n=1 Tax=Dactylosporangium sp. NPDC005555 TaxID=3154889 RepID=UPI0033BA4384